MAQTRKKRSIYQVFLLSYISILVFALSGCLIYGAKIQSQILNENVLMEQSLLASLEYDVENDLEALQDYSYTLAFDKELILAIQHMDIYSTSDLARILTAKGGTHRYMLDAFLYLPKDDEVVTASISMGASRFFDIIYRPEQWTLEELKETYLAQYQFDAFLPPLRMCLYNNANTSVEVIPYVQSLPISSFNSPSAQLIVLIDSQKLFRQATELQRSASADMYVLDEDNRLLYATSGAAELNLDSLELAEDVQHVDGGILVSRTGERSGWHYLALIPNDLYLRQNRETLLFLCGIFLIYLIVGLSLARWLAKRSYQPVKELSGLIADGEDTEETNEYDLIHTTLVRHMESNVEMRSALEAQQPVVLRDSLAHLLRRQVVDIDTARQQLSELGVQFETDSFLCAIVAFDLESPYFTDTDTSFDENLSMAKFIVENVGCELLGDIFQCYKLDMFNNQSLFILCAKKNAVSAELDLCAAQRLEKMMQFAAHHFELGLFAGISQAEAGLGRWPMCYDEAGKAVEYGQFGPTGKAALFRQAIAAENDYDFPEEAEQQLSIAVRSGNLENAHAILNRLFQANFSENQVSRIAASSFLYQLTATIQQAINARSLELGEQSAFGEEALEQILNSTSAEKAHRRLDALIDQLPAKQEHASNRTEKLVDRIAAYIDDHADDKWLDLNILSQEFGVTPQYISNVFKKQRNENVKDYISKQKLVSAKALLRDTDLPIREIAAKLGYASEASIIRMFRKYEGITPGEYRSLYRQDSP